MRLHTTSAGKRLARGVRLGRHPNLAYPAESMIWPKKTKYPKVLERLKWPTPWTKIESLAKLGACKAALVVYTRGQESL